MILPATIALYKKIIASRRTGQYQSLSSSSSDSSETLQAEDELESKRAQREVVTRYLARQGWTGRNGGWMILTWSILRLAGLIALTVLGTLAALGAEGRKESLIEWTLVGVYVSFSPSRSSPPAAPTDYVNLSRRPTCLFYL